MKESEAAAIWLGFVHGEGTGWQGKVELALGFSLVWSGVGIKTFTATGDLPCRRTHRRSSRSGSAPTATGATTRSCSARASCAPTTASSKSGCSTSTSVRSTIAGRARAWPSSTVWCATGSPTLGYPGQPTHPICHGVGARAHEPPYAHQAGGGEIAEGMVLAIEPGCYWDGGGGLRVEDNFLITSEGAEKLSPFPDGVVQCLT